MKQHFDGLPTGSALLLDWLLSLARQARLAATTITRYYRCIGNPWLFELGDQDVTGVSGHDLWVSYLAVLEHRQGNSDIDVAIYLVGEVHKLGETNANYRLPDLPEVLSIENSANPFVRARFLNKETIYKIAAEMAANEPDTVSRGAIWLAAILAFRTGLRVGEISKLRHRDLDRDHGYWLYVCANRFGNNKSTAALRKLNLRMLLSQSELKALGRYLADPVVMPAKPQHPLLSLSASNKPLDTRDLQAKFSNAALRVTGEGGWVFHHLRHSAASIMAAAIEGEEGIFRTLVETEKNPLWHAISQDFHSQRDCYRSLAVMIGHVSPTETMRSYMHLSDWILHEKLARAPFGINSVKAIKACGVSRKHAAALAPNGNLNRHSWRKGILSDLQSSATIITPNSDKTPDEPSKKPGSKGGWAMVHRALQMAEEGYDPQRIADRLYVGCS